MKVYLSLVLFLAHHFLFSQAQLVSSNVSEVRIFFHGAAVKRSCSLTLTEGVNDFEIPGISESVDLASLNYQLSSNAKVISLYLEKSEGLPQHSNSLKDNKAHLRKTLSTLNNLQIIKADLEKEKKILEDNALRIGSSSGLNLTELDHSLAYVRKKQSEINGLLADTEEKLIAESLIQKQLETSVDSLDSLIHAAPFSLFLSIESHTTEKAGFGFSYYISSCAWAPFYNIYSEGSDAPLDFEYKANLLNNSGEDWKNVSLSLSPANPANGIDLPDLETWIISYSTRSRKKRRYGLSRGNEGHLSDSQIKDSKRGYSTRQIEIEEGNLLFEIPEKINIPYSKHPLKVDINKFSKDAEYIYESIPKLDNQAYLLARFTDWEELKLIEGEANVYENGNFKGRSYIDPMAAGDTLEISLGPDPAIQITRVKKKDRSKKRFIGLYLTESFAYEIDIRNLNKKPVQIKIIDQIPVAQQSDINVSLDEKDGAELTENVGKLTWQLEIPPVETAKIKMGYSVRYPRDKIVVIQRRAKVLCPSHFW